MNAQTIIKAAEETSKYFRIVIKDARTADAFIVFAQAIKDQIYKEELREKINDDQALLDSFGSHGQG